MRFLISTLAVLAALVLISVSGAMNYLFMQGMAKTPAESYVMGGASVAVDIIKALLPVLIWWAWKDRRFGFVIPAAFVFIVFSAFSLTSAIGFAASNRGHVSALKEGANAQLAAITSEFKSQNNKRAGLPKHRPVAIVENALAAKRQHRRWSSTKGCIDGGATASKSRIFCKQYFTLKAELEAAITAAHVERRLDELRRAEKSLRDRGAGGDADPQVSLFAKLSGNDKSAVRTALVLFIACLLELGSGLGLWIATGHSEIFGRAKRAKKTEAPARESRRSMSAPSAMPVPEISASSPVAAPPAITDQSHASAPSANDTPDQQSLVSVIEDYLLERIRPAAQGGVTLATLYADYQAWTSLTGAMAAQQGFFGMVIEKAMAEVGIPHDGAHYVGIKLAPKTKVAA